MINIIILLTSNNNIKKKYIYWKIIKNIKLFKKIIKYNNIIINKKEWKFIKKPFKNKINIIIKHKIKDKKKYIHKKNKIIFLNSIIKALNIIKKNNQKKYIIIENISSKIIKWAKKIYLIYINKKIYKNKFYFKYNQKKWKTIYRKIIHINKCGIKYIVFSTFKKI